MCCVPPHRSAWFGSAPLHRPKLHLLRRTASRSRFQIVFVRHPLRSCLFSAAFIFTYGALLLHFVPHTPLQASAPCATTLHSTSFRFAPFRSISFRCSCANFPHHSRSSHLPTTLQTYSATLHIIAAKPLPLENPPANPRGQDCQTPTISPLLLRSLGLHSRHISRPLPTISANLKFPAPSENPHKTYKMKKN